MRMREAISHVAKRALIGLLMLSFLAAALPQPVQAANNNQTCEVTHVVMEGETISKIARAYSKTVNRLARTNNLEFPYRLSVGQRLCIPGLATGSANATWTARISNDKVQINGSGFRKEYPFMVRVRESDTTAWFKLGATKTSNAGELNVSFNVPRDLLRARAMNVCLKDAFTDVLVCRRAFRQ